MAKVKNELISDLNVSWENYAGSSVESFIKDQLRKSCGYIYRSKRLRVYTLHNSKKAVTAD